MIEFRHVNKAYDMAHGKNIVLNDVSFKFPEKKNIGVLGVNGAGKSTLLKIDSR